MGGHAYLWPLSCGWSWLGDLPSVGEKSLIFSLPLRSSVPTSDREF